MILEQQFQIQRFIALLKVELSKINRSTWMIIGAVFTVSLLTSLVWAADQDPEFHQIFYPIILLGGGFLFTSVAFSELIEDKSRQFYLTLPASNLEKFLSKLLVSSIAYTTFVVVGYFLFSLLVDGLTNYYYNYQFIPFAPFSGEYWLIFKLYLTLQSIFLLGAITFRKYAFFKTMLIGATLPFVFGIISFLLLRLVFFDYFGFSPDMEGSINTNMQPSKGFESFGQNILWPLVQFLFWVGLPIFFWVVAYFRLTEKEV